MTGEGVGAGGTAGSGIGVVGGGSLQAVPSAMAEAAKGIEDTVAELRDLGGVGDASVGRGLSRLALPLSRATVGHDAVASGLADLLDRWDWGVRALVQEADAIAEKLTATAAEYQRSEDAAVDLLKRVASDATTNPLGDASPTSFADAVDHAASTWGRTAQDVAANSGPGMIVRALDGQNPIQGQLDDLAGLREIVD